MKSEQNPVCVCGFWVFIDRQGWLIFWYLKSEIKAEREGSSSAWRGQRHEHCLLCPCGLVNILMKEPHPEPNHRLHTMINSQQTRSNSTGMNTYGYNVYVQLSGCRVLTGTLSFLFFFMAFKHYKMLTESRSSDVHVRIFSLAQNQRPCDSIIQGLPTTRLLLICTIFTQEQHLMAVVN